MTDSTHHLTPIDLDPAGVHPGASGESLDQAIAVTVLATTGVHTLGSAVSRAAGALAGTVGGRGVAGVDSREVDGELVVDLDIVAEYPATLGVLADTVRTQVLHAVRQMTATPVVVNVTVSDIHGPFEATAQDDVDATEAAPAADSATAADSAPEADVVAHAAPPAGSEPTS